jgi:GT2 family glycosyltransferase
MHVAVVIPMWNQLELTLRCLRSVAELAPAWTIVVDNASQPDPRTALENVLPSIEVLRQPGNLGFAGGCNAGIRRALDLGADAVLLLNNDAVAEPEMLKRLAAELEADARLGAVGAKTLTDEESPRIHCAFATLTFHAPLIRLEGWLEPDVAKLSEARDVDSVSGGAMLMRRQALADVGLLDETFFAYHEDVDWCARARARGWRIRYVPAALVYHRMHASTGGGYASPIGYLSARNSVLFVRKHGTAWQRLKFGAYTAASLLKELPRRARSGEMAGYRLRLRGLRDGLLGRPVPAGTLGLGGGSE